MNLAKMLNTIGIILWIALCAAILFFDVGEPAISIWASTTGIFIIWIASLEIEMAQRRNKK